MSIFDRIKHAIFGEAHAAPTNQTDLSASPASAAPTAGGAPAPTSSTAASAAPLPAPVSPAPASGREAPSASSATARSQSAAAPSPVDVESVLNAAVKKSGQKLDWRHSIVDLMKALGMDASLEERKELAQELGYSGDPHDSAKMNIFLHKALMQKLSENGGKVPADLID